ncbi:uncharacterized protein LOC127102487 [Lathyrus oleraceus]|uniref:uncharacterized protein LOC127102487 n=1 Tax=Pisum sativum TaxID=3888 RepID=UPI0021CE2D1A|nr:uncharacterized protein LOC127102487 [Pisum sativum]
MTLVEYVREKWLEETTKQFSMLWSQWLMRYKVSPYHAGDEFFGLGKFQRNDPPTFKGIYDPEGKSLKTGGILEAVGTEITYVVFIAYFLEKYFPESVHSKKDIEFLKLKYGNMTVVEYAAKIEELMKFCPYYNGAVAKGSKCIKIYDEDSRTHYVYYKSLSEKKGNNQYRGKLYSAPTEKGKHRVLDEKRLSGGETPTSVKCFKCGIAGHRANDYKSSKNKCFKCGKTRHLIVDCKSNSLTFFNCEKPCHN